MGSFAKTIAHLLFRGISYSNQGISGTAYIWRRSDRYAAVRSFNGWWSFGRASHSGSPLSTFTTTASGTRIAAIRGSWFAWTPNAVFEDMSWISDRDMLLPFGDMKRDILACRFDGAQLVSKRRFALASRPQVLGVVERTSNRLFRGMAA